MELVTRMAPLWRLAGNPDFDRSLPWIEERLVAAGIATRYDTIESTSQGWEMRDASVRLDSADGELVLSRPGTGSRSPSTRSRPRLAGSSRGSSTWARGPRQRTTRASE